jgi:hypothetical protein
MSIQAVVRHTRTEEETGRAELVGSAVVGRHAPLAAALITAVLANLAVGALVAVVLLANGLAVAGSLLSGLSLAGVGLVFAGVAAVASQVLSTSRGANGAGAAVVGLAFVLRAVGDVAGDIAEGGLEVVSAWPSWLSPIGWAQQTRPFYQDNFGLLALFAATAVALIVVAVRLTEHRDVGAGMVAPRPGPARAAASLGSPLGTGLAPAARRAARLGRRHRHRRRGLRLGGRRGGRDRGLERGPRARAAGDGPRGRDGGAVLRLRGRLPRSGRRAGDPGGLDGGQRGLAALVAELAAGTLDGLVPGVHGQHPERHRQAQLAGHGRGARGALPRHVVEVRGGPAHDAAERDQRVEAAGVGHAAQHHGQLEGAGHPGDGDVAGQGAVAQQGVDAPSTSRSTTASLKRAATIPTRRPEASSRPTCLAISVI